MGVERYQNRCTRCRPAAAAASSGLALWLMSATATAMAATTDIKGARPVEGPLTAGSLIQVSAGLLVVVLTIFALAWFLRRYGRFSSSANGALKVVGGLSVGPRERVVLLQIKDRQLLVGVAPGRVQMLHELEERVAPAEAEEQGEAGSGRPLFSAMLKRERR